MQDARGAEKPQVVASLLEVLLVMVVVMIVSQFHLIPSYDVQVSSRYSTALQFERYLFYGYFEPLYPSFFEG